MKRNSRHLIEGALREAQQKRGRTLGVAIDFSQKLQDDLQIDSLMLIEFASLLCKQFGLEIGQLRIEMWNRLEDVEVDLERLIGPTE